MSFVPSRPFSFPRLSCIALLVASLGLASCGGDDDDPPPAPKQADLVGVLHGVLATSLQDELGIGAPLTDMAAAVDTLQDIVLLSDPNGIDDAHPALPLLKNALHSGRAVALENVNADEVNALIKALGLRISAFSLPEGASEVELFAVRKVRGDTWFFVDVGTRQPATGANAAQGAGNATFNPDEAYDYCSLSGDEQPEVKISQCGTPGAGADGEGAARQQAQCDTRSPVLAGASSPLTPTLAKAIRTQADTQEAQKSLPASCRDANSPCETNRTRAFLDWAQAGQEEAGRAHSVVMLNSGDKLGDLVAKQSWQIVYSPGCRAFTTKYDISSYHSFAQDLDYYFIAQYGDFDPGACWQNVSATCNSGDGAGVGYQEGYIRFYEFEHALPGNPLDPKYGGYEHEVLNPTHTPENTGQKTDVTVATEKSVGGSVGFSLGWQSTAIPSGAKPSAGGLGTSASLSAGMSTSTSSTHTYKDGAVEFKAQGRQMGGLNWRYDFLRPCSAPGKQFCFFVFDYGNLQDATGLSKGTFSPRQEWTWAVPSKYSRENFLMPGERGEEGSQRGFKTHFEAMIGYSEAYFADATGKIAGHATRHRCQTAIKTSWYVPLSRPPLLAMDQNGLKDFPVGGASQVVNLASEYDWEVYDKPDWVTVEPMSGAPTSKKNASHNPGWDGSMDLRVTVYKDDKFDESKENRYGTIKIRAKGGEEEVWLNVTQTPFNN